MLDQNQAYKLKQLKLLGQVFDVKSIFKYASYLPCHGVSCHKQARNFWCYFMI